MLVEIHMIQNHAPSNLNRDDSGSPKEALFGGAMRARISSQCIKRSIRKSEIFEQEFRSRLGTRTRRVPGKMIGELHKVGFSEDESLKLAETLAKFGKSERAESEPTSASRAADEEEALPETRILIFLGHDEAPKLAQRIREVFDEVGEKKFWASESKLEKALERKLNDENGAKLPRSVDIALFGRMTTSGAFENVHASMQVAHAISTTKLDHQYDYFTAVDDLVEEAEELGAGHINDTEFNSATYYKYFSLNWEHFVGNLGGDEETARQAVAAFIRAAARTPPPGKQHSFAAHNPPDAILVEVKAQNVPISYANAFVKPVWAGRDSDVVTESISKLWEYSNQVKDTYAIERALSVWLVTGDTLPKNAPTANNLNVLVDQVLAALPEVAGQ